MIETIEPLVGVFMPQLTCISLGTFVLILVSNNITCLQSIRKVSWPYLHKLYLCKSRLFQMATRSPSTSVFASFIVSSFEPWTWICWPKFSSKMTGCWWSWKQSSWPDWVRMGRSRFGDSHQGEHRPTQDASSHPKEVSRTSSTALILISKFLSL